MSKFLSFFKKLAGRSEAASPESGEFVSDRTLEQVFNQSPSFMAFMSYPDFVYQRANDEYLKLIGRKNIIGKRVLDVVPEAEAQGFMNLLRNVAKTKENFVGIEQPLVLKQPHGEKHIHIDFAYQPLLNSKGEVYGIVSQGYDVTEKVLSRRKLQESKHSIETERENFRNLFRLSPELVCILSGPNHLFEFVNEGHEKVLGFNATGMTVREAQPESVEIHSILDNVYKTGGTAELHEIPVTLGERVRYFNLTYAARRDADGVIDGIMILGTEVTAEVDNRNAIQQYNERLKLALESGKMGTWEINLKTQVTTISPETAAIFGDVSVKKETRSDLDRFILPEDRLRVEEEFNAAVVNGKPYSLDYRVKQPSGDIRWILARGSIAKDEVGNPSVASGIVMDITERKLNAQAVSESRERYKLLFDHSPLPKWTFDIKTLQFLEVNETALRHYGYSREEFLKMKVSDVRLPEDLEFLKAAIGKPHSRSEVVRHSNIRHVKKDGTIINVEVSALDVTLNGRDARLAAIIDVTERLQVEREQQELMISLQKAKEEAERANSLKSAFLANMSHEIRTPLGAMIGFADLLRDPGLSGSERSNYTDIIARNGEQLSVIINDILDLSKVEAGHLTLEFTDCQPDHIAADIISLLRVKAKDKGLALEFTMDESTPISITSDPTRVRQVLLNLVGNSIKFTQFGMVKVRCFGCKNADGHDAVCFEVTDTGIGVPEDQRERVFEMFVQADGSMTRRFGGTGIGLALSRRLARALGGDIIVTQSEEGKGSTFLFSVQDRPERGNSKSSVLKEEKVVSKTLAEDALKGVRVLVVDDAPDNQQLIWHYLNQRGAKVESAENGWEGYRKAINGNFDIVLMDIQMPVMDGYTATQKLRDNGYKKPIIALTAHAMTEVRAKCITVGCTDHLAKPINSIELIRTIVQHTTL